MLKRSREGGNTWHYAILYCSFPLSSAWGRNRALLHLIWLRSRRECWGTSKNEPSSQYRKFTGALVGVRPEWIIPLPPARLSKSSLGKPSRTELQADFENGVHDEFKVHTTNAILDLVRLKRQVPETETESRIVQVLSEMLELPAEVISVERTIFELGITSVRLFKFRAVATETPRDWL